MNDIKIAFHLGLPRTGSTFLQRQIFPNLKNVNVLGSESLLFDYKTPVSNDKLNLVSDENLSGISATMQPRASSYQIIHRIHQVYPQAKIIVVFRDEKSWLKSLYTQYVKIGGVESFDEWLDRFKSTVDFDYKTYKDILFDLFDEVLVCDFEKLKNNPYEFLKEICDFLDVKVPNYTQKQVNIRLDDTLINRWRWMNKWFKSNANIKHGIFPEWMNPLKYFRQLLSKYGGTL